MNPLHELKSMVASTVAVETGVVTAVSRVGLTARTRSGLKSFSTPNAATFKPGDSIRFQGNVLLGRTTSVDNLPVFSV